MVFDPRFENPLVIVGSDFFLIVIDNTLYQKSGNIIRFYGKDCCLDNFVIKRSQIVWVLEHDIYCTLNWLYRLGVTETKAVGHGVVAFDKDFMEGFRIDSVGELLCSFNIRDFKECVIMHTIHIELQAKRSLVQHKLSCR